MSIMIEAFTRRDPALYVGPVVLPASLVCAQVNLVGIKAFGFGAERENKRLVALYDGRARVVSPVGETAGSRLNVTV